MELLDKYIEYLLLEKKYSKHTVVAYRKDILDFFGFLSMEFGEVEVIDVDYVYVRSWIVFLHKKNIVNRSANRKTTALKSFYSFLLKIEEIEKNPLANHKSLKTAKKIIIPFNEREVEEAMLIVDDAYTDFEQKRNKLIIHLLYATGVRQAEIINLLLKDVDLDEGTIKVIGKRNKERIVPVYKEVICQIKLYLEERKLLSGDHEFFFVTQKGVKMYNALVYRIINSYFSKVTTKQKRSPHVLRHSYATDLVSNGADLNSVKELLGHSSLAATQVYTHNSLDKLKQVYNQAHPRSVKKK